MEITEIIKEAIRVRNLLKLNQDSELNPIDMSMAPVPPFIGSGSIKLIIIGQDPTIKNKSQREKISSTLNLNKKGSLRSYIDEICRSLGLEIDNLYATNIFKYFYTYPPAITMDVLRKHLSPNLELIQNEIQKYPSAPIITLGEPVLQLLSDLPDDKVKSYWDYRSGKCGLIFKNCSKNKLGRPFYPLPHQPSLRKDFYRSNLTNYLSFIKK